MPASATGLLTANGTVIVAPPTGTGTSFPGTFAAVGAFAGGTLAVSAGFYDSTHTLQFVPITNGSLTAPGAFNVAVRCDALQLALTGAGAATITYWVG